MRGPERPSWDCACVGDHRETNAQRAWCGDCSEWCYPNDPEMLCVRGREGWMQARIHTLETALHLKAESLRSCQDHHVERRARIEQLEAMVRNAARLTEDWNHPNADAIADMCDLVGEGSDE